MSALARLAMKFGVKVSGADAQKTALTDSLAAEGAMIFPSHHADNIRDCDLLVYSSAVAPDNPERMAAASRGIRSMRRAEFLGLVSGNFHRLLAVAGTHGKTTVSGMLATALNMLDMDPSALVGGIIRNFDSNTLIGSGREYLVVEADEYDRSFLTLHPWLSIITNVDADHLDIYKDLQDIRSTFLEFTRNLQPGGHVVVCSDHPRLKEMMQEMEQPFSYGIDDPTARLRASGLRAEGLGTQFQVLLDGQIAGSCTLQVPGRHNVLNALAVISALTLLSVPIDRAIEAISHFQGIRRRFELRRQSESLIFIDDYAHHPAEIAATLSGARSRHPGRLVAVFQPHLYSRTRDFASEFAEALSIADMIVLTPIYPARETEIPGVSSDLIMQGLPSDRSHLVQDVKDLKNFLPPILLPGDMILCLGAGNLSFLIDEIADACIEKTGN